MEATDPMDELKRLVEDCDGDTLDSYELQLATNQYNLPAILRAWEADRAIVAKLPKTADGKPIIVGGSIFAEYDSDDHQSGAVVEEKVEGIILYRGSFCVQCGGCEYSPSECYSTRAAALAAKTTSPG